MNITIQEYTITQQTDGELKILRHGLPWKSIKDEFTIALATETERLHKELLEKNKRLTTIRKLVGDLAKLQADAERNGL